MRYKLFLFMLPFVLSVSVGFGRTVDTDAALKMIEAEESKLHAIKWKFQCEEWRTTPDGPQKQPTNIAGQVTYDLEKSRYHIVAVETLRWHGGKDDFISSRFGMAFDGSSFQNWRHSWHGVVPPPPILDIAGGVKEGVDIRSLKHDEKHAWISGEIGPNEAKGTSFANYYGASGLQFIGPLFSTLKRTDGVQSASAYLRQQKSKVSSIEIDNDARFMTVLVSNDEFGTIKLRLDLQHYASIISAEWLAGDKTNMSYQVKYKAIDNGEVVPTECNKIMGFDGIKHTVRFSDFEWNPKLDDSTFQLRMPPGTYVRDEFHGTAYNTPPVSR